ncbi:type II toxin-antitoxin system RelE/ParE family toxin [Allocoleopsis sp.]|jgi:toxin ParE1/3/4|uniref:type II toxin-antitoxin system RelE/ParE family toxin n=1 Tax=Allocoleopsis sp. TaxID=3088169 RepID=UPI002FD68B1A
MNRYIVSPEAKQDLRDIRNYIARDNPSAARRLVESIREKCRTLVDFPNMGRRYDDIAPEVRGVPIDSYIILYRLIEDGIEIVRVVSGYRKLESLFSESDDS